MTGKRKRGRVKGRCLDSVGADLRKRLPERKRTTDLRGGIIH